MELTCCFCGPLVTVFIEADYNFWGNGVFLFSLSLSNLDHFILIGVTGTRQAVSGTPKYSYVCVFATRDYIICTSRYVEKKGVFNLIYSLFICYDWGYSLLKYEFRLLFHFDFVFYVLTHTEKRLFIIWNIFVSIRYPY